MSDGGMEHMNIDYRDLGAKVRQLRRSMHLTQEELAEQVGISASFMGHIERGTRVASLETLVALCNVLHTNPTFLLSASLTSSEPFLPTNISASDRMKLSEFLRLAQDTVAKWND